MPVQRADDLGDFVRADFLAQQPAARLGLCRPAVGLLVDSASRAAWQASCVRRRARRASGTSSSLDGMPAACFSLIAGCMLVEFDARPRPACLRTSCTSPRPSFSRFPLLAEAGQLALRSSAISSFDLGQPLLGVLLGFLGELPGGQLQLRQPALHLVDLGRHAFAAPSPAGWRLRPSGRSPCRAGSGR